MLFLKFRLIEVVDDHVVVCMHFVKICVVYSTRFTGPRNCVLHNGVIMYIYLLYLCEQGGVWLFCNSMFDWGRMCSVYLSATRWHFVMIRTTEDNFVVYERCMLLMSHLFTIFRYRVLVFGIGCTRMRSFLVTPFVLLSGFLYFIDLSSLIF